MSQQLQELSDEEWKKIITQLQAYTRMLVFGRGWFRGPKASAYIAGKEVDDYVFEAIRRYLEDPTKYDPSRRTLVEYLKKHIIRSLVNNDLVSAENKSTNDFYAIESENHGDIGSDTYINTILPKLEVFYDDEIDYNNIMRFIESEIKGDICVENIFLGLNCGMKRADIIDEFGMTSSDFDNAMRRLITVRKRAAQKFTIEKRHHDQ